MSCAMRMEWLGGYEAPPAALGQRGAPRHARAPATEPPVDAPEQVLRLWRAARHRARQGLAFRKEEASTLTISSSWIIRRRTCAVE